MPEANLDLVIIKPEVAEVAAAVLAMKVEMLLVTAVAVVVLLDQLGQVIMVPVDHMDIMVVEAWVLQEVSPVVEAVVQVQWVIRV
jgi:hypothetical protein